ncbi:MAG TPA: hypothetical protein VHJ17_15585 [Thermomonospora sp.]|nr:hypothetical protein [Thermomonospora sp.]
MTRHTFGGGIADYVVTRGPGGELLLAGDKPVTFWDSPVGGVQHVDLVDGTGTPIPGGVVVADANGAIPAFGQGPDGVRVMWADASADHGGPRRLMPATDTGLELADLQTRLAAVEQKLAGVGRITVGPTAPPTPALGDVWLDTTAPAGADPVTFRAAAGANSLTAGSITCNLPGGLLPGDLMIAVLAMDSTTTTTTTTTPDGWTELVPPNLIGDDTRVAVYARVFAAGTPAPTWTHTAATKATVAIAAYANADSVPQVGQTGVRTGQTSVVDAPSIVTTDPNMLVVCAYGEKSSAATAITGPTGTTVRLAQLGAGQSGVPSVLLCDFAQPTPGATGVRTATWNTTSNNGLGVQIGLRRRQA